MSILARLVSRSQGVAERRYLDVNSSFVPPPGMEDAYAPVGSQKAMQSLTVFACVRLLADTIASLPWKCYRQDSDGVPNVVDPLPPVLSNPWPALDEFEWKWMTVASLASRGNSYHLVVQRDKAFRPTALMPLSPDDVYVERRAGDVDWTDPLYWVRGVEVPSQDIVHIRRFVMPGEPMGMSPIRQAAVAIGMGLEAENYGYRYFRDSAQPSSVLETDQQLDDAAIRQQQQNWISSHGGRRRPAVLSGGFKWRPISISPEESQFLETRRYQKGEIAMMYGIPPHMIGDTEKSTSWGTGIEQQSIGFAIYTLRPWLSCVENAMGQLLPRGQFVRFDTSALLRGDLKARYDAYRVARETGWMSVNEIRLHEEMEAIGPEGDVYLQPMNYAPLGYDPTEQPEPPAPEVEPSEPESDQEPPIRLAANQ